MVFQRHRPNLDSFAVFFRNYPQLPGPPIFHGMGRTEKSQGLAPPSIRKDIRAKQARHIINRIIPAFLASNIRARQGIDRSELIADPQPASSKQFQKSDDGGDKVVYVKRKGQGRRKAKGGQEIDDEETAVPGVKVKKSGRRRHDTVDEEFSHLKLDSQPGAPPLPKRRAIKVITTDCLTAAQLLASTQLKHIKKSENICILNMASPLRPGGGVLAGATSQEEFLCARTTLLPSLKEDYYRLPEYGGIFTSDVLVFRGPSPLGDSAGELGAGERYWIDVISAGMLRFPDLEGEEGDIKRLGKKDREVVERKMRAVLRIAAARRVKKLVLGAWGCGAYGNPVIDIAQAWSRVLSDSPTVEAKKGQVGSIETWPALSDVVFAIPNLRMANDFASSFGADIQVEDGPLIISEEDEEDNEEHKVTQELQAKIKEMESQISKVWNLDLKSRLGAVQDGLKAQLKERQRETDDSDNDSRQGDSHSIMSDGGAGKLNHDSDADDNELLTATDDAQSGILVNR